MDPAICGSCRSGYCRCGVYRPDWDNKILPNLKKVSARSLGGVDPAVAGGFHAGDWRAGVYVPLFDQALKALKESV